MKYEPNFHLESIRYKLISTGFLGMFHDYGVALRVSTVKLPMNHGYETCVFRGKKDNEVVEHYETEDEASAGHLRHARYMGLKTVKITR